MSFTPPPAPPPKGAPIPSRRLDSQEGFDAKTDVYLTWTEALRNWMAGFVDWAGTFSGEILASIATMGGYMKATVNAADAALGASHFKGLWQDQAGALPKPACVKNNGRFWLLLVDLPDVAAAEPGVSPAWTSMDSGTTPSQVIAVNTVAIPGVRYTLGASGVVLDISGVAYAKGDYQGVRTLSGVSGCAVEFGALKYLGRTVGTLMLDMPMARLDLNYYDNTVGMQ